MTNLVSRYVNACENCKRAKLFRKAKPSLLHPLPIPERYWQDVSVDFVGPLPKCKFNSLEYHYVMVVVDRLSKKRKFIPLPDLKVEIVVSAFLHHVWNADFDS